MKIHIKALENSLIYDYQIDIFKRLGNELDTNDVDQLDIFYRLIYNLFVCSNSNIDKNLVHVLEQFTQDDFDKNDSLQWGLLRNVFFLKIIISKQNEFIEIIMGDVNNNVALAEKRMKKVMAGLNIKMIESKIATIKNNQLNQKYAWSIQLLITLIEYDIYQFHQNIISFELSSRTKALIESLKIQAQKIDSIEG